MEKNSKEYYTCMHRLGDNTIRPVMESLGYQSEAKVCNPNSCYTHKYERTINIPLLKKLIGNFLLDDCDTCYEISGSEIPPKKGYMYVFRETRFHPMYDLDYKLIV